ncbi:MAG: AAA family ATPase [Nevskiales bacterium]
MTGNAGSGKSTLARELGAALRLPVHGLDRVVWQPGWRPTPLTQRDAMLRELAAGTGWVIDGVSRIIETQADLVVFLDVKPALCTWRCARRNWRYLFHSRPGLPENCPEILIIPQLLKIIWRFDRDVRPNILDRAAKAPPGRTYLRLQTSGEVAQWLAAAIKGPAPR